MSADVADHPMQAKLLPVAGPLLADCSPPANILLLLGGSHLPITLQSGSDTGASPPAHVLPCGKYRDCQEAVSFLGTHEKHPSLKFWLGTN